MEGGTMTVDVLGTEYSVIQSNKVDDMTLEKCDGYCDHSVKKIVIDTFHNTPDSLQDLGAYSKKVIRHELIHAFLFESGLSCNSWADNEEIVDWIAIQFPKLLKAFNEMKVV
jgi:hypothetical protein